MRKKLMLAFMALFLCGATRTLAQPVLAPGPINPDLIWYTSCTNAPVGVYISGLNTAMIDYQNIWGSSTLIVSAYEGNGTSGGVSFKDVGSGFTFTQQYCPPTPVFSSPHYITAPDIIVGNDATNPLTDFRVVVAYLDNITGKPTTDFYLVSYTGPGVFTVTYTGQFIYIVGAAFSSKTIHLDIAADYSNILLTGYPYCDKYIVTWDDAFGSYAAVESVNAFPSGAFIPLPNGTPGGTPFQPDVAAIQRVPVWPCGGPCVPEIIGCFVTNEGGILVYQEYNFTTLAGSPAAAISPGIITHNRPRIDAPDDYSINHPTIPNICYYKVVAEGYIGASGIRSLAYDNVSALTLTPLDDGWYYPTSGGAGSGPYSPTVAYGGNNDSQYQVAHFVDDIAGPGGPTTNVYMEPLSKWSPLSMVAPDVTFGSNFYYRVNTGTPAFCNGIYLNAISTPCNAQSSKTLVAWADNDPTIPVGVVKYKITGFVPPIGYVFKQGNTNGNTPIQTANWRLYPNPATTQLTMEAPAATTYTATDVLGRSVLTGTLTQGKQNIAIAGLPAGNYILTIQNNDGSKEHMTFVKK